MSKHHDDWITAQGGWVSIGPAVSFLRFNLDTSFSFSLIYGGLGVGFWGFQLMGFGACGMGPFSLFGVGAPYINIEE